MLCDATKWGHLPMAGGWYDQKPDLVDQFYYILAEKSKWEEQERKRDEANNRRGKMPGGSRGSRRPR